MGQRDEMYIIHTFDVRLNWLTCSHLRLGRKLHSRLPHHGVFSCVSLIHSTSAKNDDAPCHHGFPVPVNNFQLMNIPSKVASHLAITADDREY
jgi:hypothetical protein